MQPAESLLGSEKRGFQPGSFCTPIPGVHLDTGIFFNVVVGVGHDAGIWWAEARAAAQHPAVHRTGPHDKRPGRMSLVLKLRNPALGRLRTPKPPAFPAMLGTHRPSFCCKDKNFATLSRKPDCLRASGKFLLTTDRAPQLCHVLAMQNGQVLCPHESCLLLPETDSKLTIN